MSWWIVMVPGEYAETSELYGPFRSEEAAQAVADKWNRDNPSDGWDDDEATVMPLRSAREIAKAH